jgi:pimeloyl-ACP methyl ester carboxylesterase
MSALSVATLPENRQTSVSEPALERVILLHGLGENARYMVAVAAWLQWLGHPVTLVDYPTTEYPAGRLEEMVKEIIFQHRNEAEISFVTHSLGGMLLHRCLRKEKPQNLKRVVMVAPALEGSEVFSLYKHSPRFRAIHGPVSLELGKDEDFFLRDESRKAEYEVGIIAGCAAIDPVSWFCIPWPHDGRTTVEGTMLEGMKDHLTLFTTHEGACHNPFVIFQIGYFLRNGRFFK